jgi:membrane glycosyltransferase
LSRRRLLVGSLVFVTVAVAIAWMAYVLGADGFGGLDLAMLIAFGMTTPVVALGLWSALIGFVLRRLPGDPIAAVLPAAHAGDDGDPAVGRLAIVMPVFNEVPEQVFRHLRAMVESLDAAAAGDGFEVFVLSDSNDPAIIADEEARFRAFREEDRRPARLHYRRRRANVGFKAGNLWDFVQHQGCRFEFMLVLDADSLMSARSIQRLVRIMRQRPTIGILQPLIVGLPATSTFARIFQFGMRHGMRVYATGLAWWQGDSGPYWGHNALIRVAPFREQCELPVLPGAPPLGGHVLSHDQLEAVLMRRAGFEVRLLPLEDGSFEQNPPSLPEFMRRDLRWCQGNMQYFGLLGLDGIRPMGRVQLLLAIMMYLNSPFWLAFLMLGLAQVMAGGGFAYAIDPALGVGLLGFMLGMTFMPKILGVLDALVDRRTREGFGGPSRLLAGTATELVFSILIGPLLALAHSIFIGGLALGRRVHWAAQDRTGRALGWREVIGGLWPQTVLGLAILGYLAWLAPAILPWAAPLILGLVLAPVFARVTSSPRLGRLLVKSGLCATPEELQPPLEVRRVGAVPIAEPATQPVPGALAAPNPAEA